MIDQLQLKEELFKKCKEYIESRINAIQSAMDSVFQSKILESKSSAGDKFETGRTMMQNEETKLNGQMHRAKIDQEVLFTTSNRIATDQIGPGNLVKTSQGTYLIAIGLGKVRIDDLVYYCISAESPIGAELLDKAVGDKFVFNERDFVIQEIH